MALPQRVPSRVLRSILTLLVVVLVPLSLRAQQPPAPVVKVTGTLSNARPQTGETVRLDMRLTNEGPGDIRYVWSEVKVTGGLVVEARCGTPPSPQWRSDAQCRADKLPEGGHLDYSFDIQASNSASVLTVVGGLVTYTYGEAAKRSPDSTSFRIDAVLDHAPMTVDLAVTASEQPSPIPLGTPFKCLTMVSNLGVDPANDVVVILEEPFYNVTISGAPGVTCNKIDWRTVCRVASIAPAGQVAIEYTAPGMSIPEQVRRTISVVASNSYDPVAQNSSLERQIVVGLAAELTRVLLPIVIWESAGAYESRWTSEVSLYVDDETELFVFPTDFECPITCASPPLYGSVIPPRTLTKLGLTRWPDNPGHILRFDAGRAPELSFTARIRDLSRESDDWGTAVPVVTDDELLHGRLQLVDVAAGPRFRQMLRVYEPDATGASVRVRVWGGDESETLLGEETLVLEVSPYNQRPDMNAGLPFSPGYAEIAFAERFPTAANYLRLRVELQPLSDATRYWAFVSITNNETQHVTLVTPERGGR